MTGEDSPGADRTRVEVCPADELPPGSRTIVEADGLEIGVFNVDGELYAIANVCPHQLAPLAEGQLTGEMVAPAVGEYELRRDGRVVRCPWHGWKFDLETGESVFNPHLRTRTFDAAFEASDAQAACEGGCEYGTELAGDEPPVETYDVEVEREVVVLYL